MNHTNEPVGKTPGFTTDLKEFRSSTPYIKYNDMFPDHSEVLAFLREPLSLYRPDFSAWYQLVVIPTCRTGLREIIQLRDGPDLLGVAILLHDPATPAICTFYIAPGSGKHQDFLLAKCHELLGMPPESN